MTARKIILLCLISLVSLVVRAQQDAVEDSILSLIPAAHDTMRVKLLGKLCWRFVYSDPGKALTYGKQGVELSEQIDWDRGIAGSYNRLGVVWDVKGNNDSALHYYAKALEVGKKLKSQASIAGTLNNIGLIEWRLNHFESANDYFFGALENFEAIRDSLGISSCLNNIALVFFDLRDFYKAEEYHHKALRVRRALKDEYGIAVSLGNLGSVLMDLDRYDSALVYIEQSCEIKRRINDRAGLMISEKLHGIALSGLGRFEEARAAYDTALTISYAFQADYERASIYNNRASLFSRFGRHDLALLDADSSIYLATQTGNPRLESMSWERRSRVLKEMGKFPEALSSLKQAKLISDSIYSAEKTRQINDLETRYKTIKLEESNAELAGQIALSALRRSQSRTILYFSLGAVALILLSVYLFNKRQLALKEQANQLQRLEASDKNLQAIVKAVESERSRIASSLKDQLAIPIQQMSGHWKNISQSLHPEDQERISNLMRVSSMAAEEVQRIAIEMMPVSLSEHGLAYAIQLMLDNSLKGSAISYRFEQENAGGRFPEHVEIALYRIAQELVNNAIKHSRATELKVSLVKSQGKIKLTVEDNGQGFDPAVRSNGIGMMNIRGRLSAVNGELQFGKAEHSGTKAEILIPVSASFKATNS